MTKKLLSTLLLSFVTASIYAQSAIADDKTETIEVRGKVPPSLLYKRLTTARLDFYDLFNQVNDVDEYRMVCTKEKAIGSNFRKLKCEPAYYKEKARELATTLNGGNLNGLGARVTPQQLANYTKETKEKADAHTIKLIQENDALWEKYQSLLKASKAYQESVAKNG